MLLCIIYWAWIRWCMFRMGRKTLFLSFFHSRDNDLSNRRLFMVKMKIKFFKRLFHESFSSSIDFLQKCEWKFCGLVPLKQTFLRRLPIVLRNCFQILMFSDSSSENLFLFFPHPRQTRWVSHCCACWPLKSQMFRSFSAELI